MTEHLSTRARRFLGKPLGLVLLGLSLAGCVSPVADSTGRYAHPIGSAPVISNETPYSNALRCLARFGAGRAPRVAVGQIADYTGKEEFEGGRKVTQGAALMAISALSKAGTRLVERFDTSVAELELKYANNRLITDAQPGTQGNYRKILAGSIPGSDYYLVGGITELNYNIRSNGADAFVGDSNATGTKGTLGLKLYVMNVGLDLRLVDTNTLEVVDVISYQKQIIGREISAGVFDFLGETIIDVGIGERALEPIQLAVRSVIERAVLEMIARKYGVTPDACRSHLGPAGDPLAAPGDQAPLTHTRTAHAATQETTHETRNDPYGWYSEPSSDDLGLRGRVR